VLYHSDNVEASGFVQHLKLPHYVDFQSELELVRRLRAEHPALHAEPQHEDAA
jgi:alpha-D-ribose 1-methylphosphonate 5-triphosphate synthase subunit PhnI